LAMMKTQGVARQAMTCADHRQVITIARSGRHNARTAPTFSLDAPQAIP
jgi:hypothetical protein